MFPKIQYDHSNGIAYIAFTDHTIEKSIESDDELLVFDVDKNGELVGIEVMSVERLKEKFDSSESAFLPSMIPAYIIPQVFRYRQTNMQNFQMADGVI